MKKEEVRKEYFKLKIKGHLNNQCRKIILAQFGYEVSIRTLRRWTNNLNKNEWDLKDKSKRPKTIHYKINPTIEEKIINLRYKTGFGEHKIVQYFLVISHATVYKILKKNHLTNHNPNRKRRIKYIRWQREHPNSLWQMGVSDQKIKDKYCFDVIDDCSRFCVGLTDLNLVTTSVVTPFLDELEKVHGYPREILTDNGSVFVLKSKHSKFDV